MKNPTHSINMGRHEANEYDQVKTADGHGWTSVRVATAIGEVTLQINVRALTSYAIRAVGSKAGRCRLANGGIEFVASHRSRASVAAKGVSVSVFDDVGR